MWSRSDQRRAYWAAAAIIACVVLYAMLSGCSSTQRIANAATDVRVKAVESEQRFDSIRERAAVVRLEADAIVDEAASGAKASAAIARNADVIAREVPGVQDRPSEWLGTLTWLAIAAVAVAAVVLVWQLGLGRLTRTVFGWVPRRQMAAAKLLDEASSDYATTTVEEAVAAMRGMDPDFDAAWRRRRLRDEL